MNEHHHDPILTLVPPIGSPIPEKKGGATLCLPLGDFILIPKMGIVYSLTLKKGHLRYLESPGALHLEIGHIPCQEIHNAFAKNLRVSGMSWMSSRFSTCQNIVCKEHLQNWRQFLTHFFFWCQFRHCKHQSYLL